MGFQIPLRLCEEHAMEHCDKCGGCTWCSRAVEVYVDVAARILWSTNKRVAFSLVGAMDIPRNSRCVSSPC